MRKLNVSSPPNELQPTIHFYEISCIDGKTANNYQENLRKIQDFPSSPRKDSQSSGSIHRVHSPTCSKSDSAIISPVADTETIAIIYRYVINWKNTVPYPEQIP
ncbi:hypothetical protein JTB14_017840 [Gonioctena quinquepunctata]|nr:hypothetical protein JTB14_017840 [Gonioctena quinquepunctata]